MKEKKRITVANDKGGKYGWAKSELITGIIVCVAFLVLGVVVLAIQSIIEN